MNIKVKYAPYSDAEDLIISLLVEEFSQDRNLAKKLYDKNIAPHITRLKNSIHFVAETFYIDKVYRDSFYSYYSSKFNKYQRDCVRISFFDKEVKEEHFRMAKWQEFLTKSYLGFIVLRPTPPSFIGRSLISPKALKDINFKCCATEMETSVNGVKLTVVGFPHSSQDSETMSCAETTLWALMEYFGNKYSDYSPTLPSKIVKTIKAISPERLLPSHGLSYSQISYALSDFGIGTRIYSRENFGADFEPLISCYVESGIPVVCLVDNKPKYTINHALLAIGNGNVVDADIDKIAPIDLTKSPEIDKVAKANKLVIFDYDSIDKQFILVDDNRPVYQKANLQTPTKYNLPEAPDWDTCKISQFIVPHYSKIYLEAFEAKKFVINNLIVGLLSLANTEVLIRLFLAPSASFKNRLALDDSFNIDIKNLILESPMPKFIWVTELTTKALLKTKMANGLIILDATEKETRIAKPLIFSSLNGKTIRLNYSNDKLENFSLSVGTYSIYHNNLKSF